MMDRLKQLEPLEPEAIAAWNRGAPQASGPEEANRAWAPYFSGWGDCMQHDLGDSTIGRPSARIGWITDQAFWFKLLEGFDRLFAKSSSPIQKGMYKDELQDIFQEAGRVGNTVALQAVHSYGAGDPGKPAFGWQSMMCTVDVLYPKSVVQFIANATRERFLYCGRPSAAYFSAEQTTIEHTQEYAWSTLLWRKEGAQSFFAEHTEPTIEKSMDATVALVRGAFESFPFRAATQVNILGHVLLNVPAQWTEPEGERASFMDALLQNVGHLLDPSVDMNMVALCCGMGQATNDALRDVQRLGHHFAHGVQRVQEKDGPHDWPMTCTYPTPSTPSLTALRGLYDIVDAKSLYFAAMQARLNEESRALLPIDGLIDTRTP